MRAHERRGRLALAGRRGLGNAAILALGLVCFSCDSSTLPRAGLGSDRAASAVAPPEAELLTRFKSEAVAWIRAERARTRPRAAPLDRRDRAELAGFFSPEILARVRLLAVPSFENPEFFSIFEAAGEPDPIDFRRARGLALVDTILITTDAQASPSRSRLLFHELVHVIQFETLGVEGYMNGYIESWAGNGRRYREIAHEQQAYDLARRFSAGGAPFSVEAEVRALFSIAPQLAQ